MTTKHPRVEEFQVTGHQLLAAIKELIHEGNIRRISIRNSRGVTLLEIPLVVGLAGAVFAPVWAAVGAFAALVAKCTLVVEREEGTHDSDGPPPGTTARSSRTSKSRPRKRSSRDKA
jgi:Domain of unknown function (DUF4342)